MARCCKSSKFCLSVDKGGSVGVGWKPVGVHKVEKVDKKKKIEAKTT